MKKLFICLAIFLTAGIALNQNANAEGCETSLPETLQSCFLASHLSLDVTVSGGTATIDGTINTAGQTNQMQACIDSYNTDAASCPGAPTLIFGNLSSTTLNSVYSSR